MVRIFWAGDVVNLQRTSDLCSESVREIIRGCDLAIANLEAPLLVSGVAIPKAGPSIFQNPETAALLRESGFSAVSLANNHMLDYGIDGVRETQKCCKQAGLDSFGVGDRCDAFNPHVRHCAGQSIAILACGEMQFGALDPANESGFGYPWIGDEALDKQIRLLKKSHDWVFLFVHAGLEDAIVPLHQWRLRYRQLCDIGADAVIGSHPHVPQGYEIYGGKPIVYSLGNFYFGYGEYAHQENATYSVIFELSPGGAIVLKPIFTHTSQISGQIELLPAGNNDVDLDHLNAILLDPHYEIEETKVCSEALNSSVLPLMQIAMGMPKPKMGLRAWWRYLKNVVFFPIRSLDSRQRLFLHLIRNESYRWAAETALRRLSSSQP